MSTEKGPLLSAERIQLIRQKYQAGQGRPENGDDGPYAYRAQGVQIGCEIAKEIYEAERKELLWLVQFLINDQQDFVDKVDRGEAKSKRSCSAFKRGIELAANYGITPTPK